MTLDDALNITHHFSSGLYAKQMVIPKDSYAFQHKHEYDHLSVLATGKVLVKKDDNVEEIVAPACVNIEARKTHSILALEDCVWFCIHATHETNHENIDEVLIMKEEV